MPSPSHTFSTVHQTTNLAHGFLSPDPCTPQRRTPPLCLRQRTNPKLLTGVTKWNLTIPMWELLMLASIPSSMVLVRPDVNASYRFRSRY